MIAVVDYGVGNIRAFLNIFKRLNIPAEPAAAPRDLERADKILLPGVGAFDWAMTRLDRSGLRPALDHSVLQRKVPVLGVCIGMQMMAGSSEEGALDGLRWIPGKVVKLRPPAPDRPMALPHMGWNDVSPRACGDLFQGLEKEPRFYFLHSYHFQCEDEAHVLAETNYYGGFACAVRAGNILGVQFHPEKSHQCGIRLLQNFALM